MDVALAEVHSLLRVNPHIVPLILYIRRKKNKTETLDEIVQEFRHHGGEKAELAVILCKNTLERSNTWTIPINMQHKQN